MNERKKKSRRWLSFRLRTALVLLTCFGIWLGWFVPRVQKQKRAVEWVRSLGGFVAYGFELDSAGSFVGDATPYIPQSLISGLGIDFFYSIQMVYLEDQPVDASSPGSSFVDFRSLEFVFCETWDATPLQDLSRLEKLTERNEPLDDISALSNLKNLKMLYVSDARIHDIEPLRGLRDLEVISLANTDIADLTPLANHQRLTHLYISNTKVSSIVPLKTCAALIQVNLEGTDVPDSDIEALQELLPNCKIKR